MDRWIALVAGGATIFGVIFAVIQAFAAEASRRRRTPSGQLCFQCDFFDDSQILEVNLAFIGSGITWNVVVVPVDEALVLSDTVRGYMDAASAPLVARFQMPSGTGQILIAQKPGGYSPVGKIQLLTFKKGKVTETKGWAFSCYTRLRRRRIIKRVERNLS